jgi:hypothetical protein
MGGAALQAKEGEVDLLPVGARMSLRDPEPPHLGGTRRAVERLDRGGAEREERVARRGSRRRRRVGRERRHGSERERARRERAYDDPGADHVSAPSE